MNTGTFRAALKDFGMSQAEGKEPHLFFIFDVHFSETENKEMTYRSYLHTEKAQEFTFKLLDILGMKGTDPGQLAEGPDSKLLELGREVNVVIEMSEPNEEGKQFYNIKWVNAIGGGNAVKRADPALAKAALAKLNIKGTFAKYRALNPAAPADPWD